MIRISRNFLGYSGICGNFSVFAGYAKEATLSVLHYIFDALRLTKVEADVDEPNKASIRVLEALVMSQTRREIVNEHPLLYYEIQTWNTAAI